MEADGSELGRRDDHSWQAGRFRRIISAQPRRLG
jgi:hypothetical protein